MPTCHDPDLFDLPKEVPNFPRSVPALSIPRADELLDDDAFLARVEAARDRFDMQDGELRIRGDRAIVRSAGRSLEVFRASDSEWWTDHHLANLDDLSATAELPSESAAEHCANGHLQRLCLDTQTIRVSTVTPNDVERYDPETERSERAATVIDVNYRFTLKELPIFGPGAKVKVTLGHGAQLAQVSYFWREWRAPEREVSADDEQVPRSFKLMTADEALTRFQRSTAFFKLRGTGARIVVDRVELGYYALPPAQLQRYYIPVFRIEAMVTTKVLGTQRLQTYVVATVISDQEAKRLRIVSNPAACRVF